MSSPFPPVAVALLLATPAAAAPAARAAQPTPAASAESDEAFRANIAPLLLTRCSPCHAPGGKMYAKLPFDQPPTVRAHAPGVLKRLKGNDKETVQAWLERR